MQTPETTKAGHKLLTGWCRHIHSNLTTICYHFLLFYARNDSSPFRAVAVWGKRCTTGCRPRLACQRSYLDCIFIQSSAEVPKAADSRRAILAEIPALPLSTRDKVTREIRRCAAAADTGMSPRYSRRTRPGCGGLCMCILLAVIAI